MEDDYTRNRDIEDDIIRMTLNCMRSILMGACFQVLPAVRIFGESNARLMILLYFGNYAGQLSLR
jgi:hypothetical protein